MAVGHTLHSIWPNILTHNMIEIFFSFYVVGCWSHASHGPIYLRFLNFGMLV